MKRIVTRACHISEQGSASAELVIALPILAMIITGIIGAARLAYTHLAVMTVANDCVTSAAQVANNTRAGNQGFAASDVSLSAYNIPRPLRGMASGTGSTLCSASLVIMGPPTDYLVSYTFHLPFNPYKSDWEADR